MPAPKGTQPPAKGRGRPKGSPNKIGADVKAMILEALARKGGVTYLAEQADKNPTAFLTLVGKVLPMTVQGDPENPLMAGLTVTFVQPKD